ncbi:HdaA/DnaA family protein [Sphingomonas xanthus]|uniref:Chromosomal replication initiator DnaA n=1 Tax=Sphingomonas xanthus TaxID=2594473 RepID=A0A516ITN8_9SPHN|nr:DnaA/Hda family protein [Sphingomonas xanthus]QDP20269.1 chromosomal replication initiator DnaA [Sphingomonas xanthus]
MKRPADQIALPLDWPQARDHSRFILSDANREAYEHFRAWSLWPVKATILTGPPRSGRSLLARTFVERVHGRLYDRAERHNEAELFHAWNAAQDDGRPLVMVVDEVPPQWEVALPDLRTRLAITPIARIQLPDDELFRSLIRLLFADRGMHIPEEALRYVSQRVERSYWTAERVVDAIDRFAIAERARLTLPTVRRALAEGGIIDSRGAA